MSAQPAFHATSSAFTRWKAKMNVFLRSCWLVIGLVTFFVYTDVEGSIDDVLDIRQIESSVIQSRRAIQFAEIAVDVTNRNGVSGNHFWLAPGDRIRQEQRTGGELRRICSIGD